jgi:hypothetical protein
MHGCQHLCTSDKVELQGGGRVCFTAAAHNRCSMHGRALAMRVVQLGCMDGNRDEGTQTGSICCCTVGLSFAAAR